MHTKVFGLVVGIMLSASALAQDEEITASAGAALFIDAASQSDIYEIASSRLAVDRAQSQEVRNYAQEMIDAHTRTTVQLLPLADALGLTPVSDSTAAQGLLLDQLRTLDGPDFDSAYLEQQLRAHEDAVTIFTLAAPVVQDEALKAFVDATLPVLEEHLLEARELTGAGTN